MLLGQVFFLEHYQQQQSTQAMVQKKSVTQLVIV